MRAYFLLSRATCALGLRRYADEYDSEEDDLDEYDDYDDE